MARNLMFLTGIGVGLGLMYLMDPNQGARRRALVRDRAIRARHGLEDLVGKARRQMAESTSPQDSSGGGYAASEVMSGKTRG